MKVKISQQQLQQTQVKHPHELKQIKLQNKDLHSSNNVHMANNVINGAHIGMKAMHGSRNVLITGNQFARNDLWAIGLMPGAAAHPAADGKPENADGGSVIANNIISDFGHGEAHWMWGKEGYFDPAFHIPLIIRDPRPAADAGRGRVVEQFSESVDIMPTILEWLGLEVPAQCDGRSLLPFLAGDDPAGWRQEAHWEYDFRDVVDQSVERALGLDSDQCTLNVIRTRRLKYVHFTALPPLLFDLERDPDELVDRAGDPDYRDARLDLGARLLSWRMEHADRVLTGMHLTRDGVFERRPSR